MAYKLAHKFSWCYGPAGGIIIACAAIFVSPHRPDLFMTITTLVLTYPLWYFLAMFILASFPYMFYYFQKFIKK